MDFRERFMSDNSVFEVPAEFAKNTNCDAQKYADMYAKSIDDPETFWAADRSF